MFTEKFLATPMEQRPLLVEEERLRRVTENPEAYVAVPVIVPKMSSVVQGAVADYELFWLVGLPGPMDHPKVPGKKAREAINFQCSREETAEDLIYALNNARLMREMQGNIKVSMQEEVAARLQEQEDQQQEETPDPDKSVDILTAS